MKSLFIAAALCFSTLGTSYVAAPVAQAQMPQDMMSDIQDIGNWANQFNDFNIEINQLFSGPEFEDMFASLEQDDIVEMERRYTEWKAVASDQVTAMKAKARSFPTPPKIKSRDLRKMQGALDVQYESIIPTADQVSDMVSQIDSVVNRSLSGDDTGLTDLSKIVIRSAQRMILSENVVLETSVQSIPKDHPNRFLIRAMRDINSMASELLEMTILSLDGMETFQERQDIIARAEAHLAKARQNIRQAGKANKKYITKMNRAFASASNPQEKRLFTAIMKMFSSFDDSIETETQHIDLIAQQIEVLKRDEWFSDIEAEIASLDQKTYRLIDDRLSQQGTRTQLLSELQ